MRGFTMYLIGKDYFFATERQNKTGAMATEILLKLKLPVTPENVQEVLRRLQKATCEIRTLANGRRFYEIAGDGFGGRGSFMDDGMTVVIHLNK